MKYNVQFPGFGIDITVNRVAFTFFGTDIYWYGIILATGMLLSLLVAFNLAKRKNINTDHLVDVVIIGTIFSIICARAYYVIFAPFNYNSFFDMINIRDGGIAIYGAVIGAFVFGGLACKWRKIDMLEVFDIVAVCFLLGQGIGRWGNFVNQEAFGINTNLPWGMISQGTTEYLQSVQSNLAAKGIFVDPSMPVHPTFLYESLWCLIGFVILLAYYNRRKFKGELLCLYLIWYGAERFLVEGLRTDSLETGSGIRMSQLVAVVTVVISIAFVMYKRKKAANKSTVETSSPVSGTDTVNLEDKTENLTDEQGEKITTPQEDEADGEKSE